MGPKAKNTIFLGIINKNNFAGTKTKKIDIYTDKKYIQT